LGKFIQINTYSLSEHHKNIAKSYQQKLKKQDQKTSKWECSKYGKPLQEKDVNPPKNSIESKADMQLKEKDREIMKLKRRLMDMDKKVEALNLISKLKADSCNSSKPKNIKVHQYRGDAEAEKDNSEWTSMKQDTASFHHSHNTSFNS